MNFRPWLLVALVAALTATVGALAWWQVERAHQLMRQQVLVQAEQRGMQLADAMAGQVGGLLGSLDLALQQLRREWNGDARRFDDSARAMLAALPPGSVTHISVVDADGYIAYNSLGLSERTYVGDREHFRAHLGGEDRLLIGKPVLTRLGKVWTFNVNRPILRDGRFAGTLNMLVSAEYLSNRLAGLALTDQDVIALLHGDGSFLARSRDFLDAMGRGVSTDRPFLAPDAAARGVLHMHGSLDNKPRIYAWYRLPEYGLISVVGLAEETVLAPLDAGMRRDRTVGGGLIVLVAVFGGFIALLLLRAARGQAAIAASEASLREAQRIARMGSWQYELGSGAVTWSPEIYRIHEVDPRSFQPSYEAFLALVHPEDRERVERGYRESVVANTPFAIEYRILLADGGVKHLRVKGETEHRDGLPVRSMGTSQDITERTLAEHALREKEALLAEAQRLAHLGNWSLELDSGRAIWSEEEYRLLGYAPYAVEAGMENFVRAVDDDDRDEVDEAMRRAMDPNGEATYRVEHRVTVDGQTRYVEQRGHVTFSQEGRPLRMFGTTMDITERKHAEASLKQLNEDLEARVAQRTVELVAARDEAERASRAKSEFLSRMSHELRTPLNAIIGFGQLLELDLRDHGHVDSVREILHAGKHLLELINEVLDLASIEAGKLTISLEPVALMPLIEECLTLIRPLAQARQIIIADTQCRHDAHVLADRVRLKQVLLNLLSNAVKYNRERGGFGIACEVEGDSVLLRVSDTGAGLTAAQQARLFNAFERLDEDSGAIEGTGIGLALSKRLIELLHGEIGVESTPGVGSAFWVRLPACEAAAQPARLSADESVTLASERAGQARWKVLCIEDNPANLHLLERILARRADIRLLTAANPGLGLELAQAHMPALILLDINLPDMDGYEVMKRLRAHVATRDIPVVAVSANAMPSDLDRGKAAGFADYLTKPLKVDLLLRVVDAHLDGQLRASNQDFA